MDGGPKRQAHANELAALVVLGFRILLIEYLRDLRTFAGKGLRERLKGDWSSRQGKQPKEAVEEFPLKRRLWAAERGRHGGQNEL